MAAKKKYLLALNLGLLGFITLLSFFEISRGEETFPNKSVKNKHYNFLETLAEDVFDELFKDKRIDKITLQIEKMEIMKDCSSVGIQISKKRSHDKL